MAGVEQGNISKEEFMERVARYERVYHRNSKDFKDKSKKTSITCGWLAEECVRCHKKKQKTKKNIHWIRSRHCDIIDNK